MRRFAYALVMFLGTMWSRTWKKIFRSKRTFFTTAMVVGIVAVVWVGIRLGGGGGSTTDPAQPGPDPSATAEYRTTTAEPIPQGGPTPGGSPSLSLDGGPSVGDGPQAAEHGETLSTSPRPVAKPTKPAANTDKAAEVTKAWATAYLSRDADSDQWKEWMTPYVVPELRDYLTDSTTEQDNPITTRVPSEVAKVTIGKNAPKGAPADTPVRWTRDVDVAVATGDGRTTTITYRLTLNKTGEGWKVRNAVEDGWTTKATR